jgi:hypothetical protein
MTDRGAPDLSLAIRSVRSVRRGGPGPPGAPGARRNPPVARVVSARDSALSRSPVERAVVFIIVNSSGDVPQIRPESGRVRSSPGWSGVSGWPRPRCRSAPAPRRTIGGDSTYLASTNGPEVGHSGRPGRGRSSRASSGLSEPPAEEEARGEDRDRDGDVPRDPGAERLANVLGRDAEDLERRLDLARVESGGDHARGRGDLRERLRRIEDGGVIVQRDAARRRARIRPAAPPTADNLRATSRAR